MSYNKTVLLEKLKGRGLDLAEESLGIINEELFNWLRESAEESKTPLDNLLIPVYNIAEEKIAKAIDKLDGEVG